MTTLPTAPPAQPDPAGHNENHRPWRVIIDGWVKDPEIRRDALIAFVLLLVAIAVIVAIAFPSGASALCGALSGALSPLLGKIILGTGTAGTLGTIGVMRYRKRKRAREQSTLPVASQRPGAAGVLGSVPSGDSSGEPAQPFQRPEPRPCSSPGSIVPVIAGAPTLDNGPLADCQWPPPK